MKSEDGYFRNTGSYRIQIDTEGKGHIRIIKRVNFRTILIIIRDLYLELKKNPDRQPHIIIYISPSLSSEMSLHMRDFLDFASSCIDGDFELAIIE